MQIPKKLLNLLEVQKIKYKIVEHRKVFTAYDLAATLKRKLNEVAKTIFVVADKKYYLAVVAADRRVDFKKLKKAMSAKNVMITKEALQKRILGIKQGAITPFGELYKKTPVIIDKGLLKVKKLLASAGTFEHSLEMSAKDLLKATAAKVAEISEKPKVVKKKKRRII